MNEQNPFDQQPQNDQSTTTYTSPLEQRLKQDEERKRRDLEKKNNKGSKAGYFLSALSGMLIGALLIWLLLPAFADQLPTTNNNDSSNSNHTSSSVTQNSTSVTTDVTQAVDTVSSAVVGITNIQQTTSGGFFSQPETSLQEVGSGSGVVYKIDNGKAYIVTNHHVVEDAAQLEVTLADDTKAKAELLGSDVWTDLAVITIDAEKVSTVAQFGNSDSLKVGEPVIAIGNPLGLDFYGSVTQGIVSGKDRSVPVDLDNDGTSDWTTEVLQTDAAINAGNSGGALVNLAGELVGINSMKIASSEVEGLGFSIPINTAIPIIEELEKNGSVQRPTMGVSLMDLSDVATYYQQTTLQIPEEVTNGVVITNVSQGSAAEKGGIQRYDVIVEMDGEKIENAIDLRKHLYNEKKVGDTLSMKVYRQGKLVELSFKLLENIDL